jgi:5-methylcytosine-specific restriction protein A
VRINVGPFIHSSTARIAARRSGRTSPGGGATALITHGLGATSLRHYRLHWNERHNVPRAPQCPCSHPGCNALVDHGRCEKHAILQRREIDDRRGSAASRGYGKRWDKAAKLFRQLHPLCAMCSTVPHPVASKEVDHIIPHKGDMELFWDQDNWQALCKSCHSTKTAKEDGRWARNDRTPI